MAILPKEKPKEIKKKKSIETLKKVKPFLNALALNSQKKPSGIFGSNEDKTE